MIKKILFVVSTLLALVSLFLFYDSYWQQKFNTEGNSFDPSSGVVHHDSAFVWGLFAIIFSLPLIIFSAKKSFRRNSRDKS